MTSRELAILNEGYERKPYADQVGKTTIGIGRNLTDLGLSVDEIEYLFSNDLKRVEKELDLSYPWNRDLDEVRRAALIDLDFNMGIVTLSQFKNSLRYFSEKNFSKTANNLMLSKWYRQVGDRGPRIVNMIRTGQWPEGV